MKKIIIPILLFISCSKSTEKPQAPAQPQWVVVNNHYESQTYVNYITLNGKKIMGAVVPGQVKVDSTDAPKGTLVITMLGGGGGDHISYTGFDQAVPASTDTQRITLQIDGYIAISLGK